MKTVFQIEREVGFLSIWSIFLAAYVIKLNASIIMYTEMEYKSRFSVRVLVTNKKCNWYLSSDDSNYKLHIIFIPLLSGSNGSVERNLGDGKNLIRSNDCGWTTINCIPKHRLNLSMKVFIWNMNNWCAANSLLDFEK